MSYSSKKSTIICVMSILCFLFGFLSASEAENFNKEAEIIQRLVGDAKDVRIRDLFGSEYTDACLVSEFPKNGKLVVNGITCRLSGNAIALFSSQSGRCEVVTLEHSGKILTGSEGEWDCTKISDETYLEVLDRAKERFIFLERHS
jgi:hypothetical protein